MDVQDAIDNFELRFFSYQQRKDSGATFNQKRRRQQQQDQDDAEAAEDDDISAKDLEIKNLEMKLLRREARKNTDNLIPDEVEDDGAAAKEAPAAKSSLFKRR